MKSLFGNVKLGAPSAGRPPVALEIALEGVLGAALPASGQSPIYAYQALPAGAIVPGIAEPNVRLHDAVAAAIRSVLGHLSPRTRALTLVLPDTAVRVFVLDFDTLPTKAAEADPVLRFRLRKMVPFEVEHAGLSYQILVQDKAQVKVLAAVVPAPILQEYESLLESAGCEAGAVLPSTLAALAGVDSMEAVLTANLSGLALTTSIATGQDLLLYRTLDLPEDPTLRLAEIQRGVAVAAAYYEDKLQARPSRLLFSGARGAEDFSRWLDNPDLPVTDLKPRPDTGAVTGMGEMSIAGVSGALAEAS